MFYRLIEQKRDEWFSSDGCTVRSLLAYIETTGKMRDAQVEAIKTYLFLKIACRNKPLWELFSTGYFNSLDIDAVSGTPAAHAELRRNPAAVGLLEYACLRDKKGKQLSPQLEKHILSHTSTIDCVRAFRDIFYGVRYADYLFSLPMGAGKTYLMAAFIYLDLYFAQLEPDNPAFAHNFMVLAPSGLKSSIVPSLRSIRNFDPSWIIPEPTASQLKRLIHFEVLDEQRSASKSNRVKNPNAQKLANLQPFDDMMGLVAITNAEKVILDRVDNSDEDLLLSADERKKTYLANELRHFIGKIPHLAIIIDEVHHAADGEIKLRKVVNQWSATGNCTGVLGFSGTPYLEKAENVLLGDSFTIRNTDLSNVVYHYPLAQGIGNFLKIPAVKHVAESSEDVIRRGVREFCSEYGTTVYHDGTCAKLAIYCGLIENLEETVYPIVAEILSEQGMNPAESILKYHGGNKTYPQPENAEFEFASLDTSLSKIRVVLLVQIGKEGWDCHSLASVILPHEKSCPRNMVLQTCCRCLRQVQRHAQESALIWLNESNASTLNKQLLQRQNISLREFCSKPISKTRLLNRYSRMDVQKVPPIDFYQLKVRYETLVLEAALDTADRLRQLEQVSADEAKLVHTQDLEGRELALYEAEALTDVQTPITFNAWLHDIAKGSFNSLAVVQLKAHEDTLRKLYAKISTGTETGYDVLRPGVDHARVKSLIRQAFVPKRDFATREDIISTSASLLQINRLTSPVTAAESAIYHPEPDDVEKIMQADAAPQQVALTPEMQALMEQLKALGGAVSFAAQQHEERHRTYHYLPYHFDSRLEVEFFTRLLALQSLKDKNLEFYFNGDDTLTEFKIECYHRVGQSWQYIGRYVPDFLLLSRSPDGGVHKVIIIETKGEGFAAKHEKRRAFMENEFIRKNNERFGYARFDYLYLEDTMPMDSLLAKTHNAVISFFND